ncbi:MAG TPA: glycosyltransferase family 4 protein [Burkholderiales bacterium]|nr:glycosyltransferase family 4 protein [Burkholderiales bacterium]
MDFQKILFVTGSLVHGGAERHSIALMNRLAERGHECHAVYVKNDPSQLDRIQLIGKGTVRCLDARHYFDIGALRRFTQFLRELGPSVVVAANPYALMYAWLALSLSGCKAPLIVTYHTTKLLSIKEHLQLLLYRLFFWTSACCVFVCRNQQRYWRPRGVFSRRNEVIYNGVDIDHFSNRLTEDEREAVRASFGFGHEDYVIGISAVLRPEKNHVQLVDAVAELRRRGIPARALMIGDGPTRQQIEQRARALDVEGDVRITGFQRNVRPLIAACDVIVLCSVAVETFSLAAIEAMAMQKTVVHSDIGGASEMIVDGENGFLFPAGDTESLVEKLAILSDRCIAVSMAVNARKIVEENFSEGKMIDRYESLLSEIAPRTSPRQG